MIANIIKVVEIAKFFIPVNFNVPYHNNLSIIY